VPESAGLLSPGLLHVDHAITLRDEESVQSAPPLIIESWSDNSASNRWLGPWLCWLERRLRS
jgi:hypothetical protein